MDILAGWEKAKSLNQPYSFNVTYPKRSAFSAAKASDKTYIPYSIWQPLSRSLTKVKKGTICRLCANLREKEVRGILLSTRFVKWTPPKSLLDSNDISLSLAA